MESYLSDILCENFSQYAISDRSVRNISVSPPANTIVGFFDCAVPGHILLFASVSHLNMFLGRPLLSCGFQTMACSFVLDGGFLHSSWFNSQKEEEWWQQTSLSNSCLELNILGHMASIGYPLILLHIRKTNFPATPWCFIFFHSVSRSMLSNAFS